MHRSERNQMITASAPLLRVGTVTCAEPSTKQLWIDESLEQCLLDTKRHVSQLEEIALRLSALSLSTPRASAESS